MNNLNQALSFIFAFYFCLGLAEAQTEADYWVNHVDREVTLAAKPVITATLLELNVDPQTKGSLTLSMEYESGSTDDIAEQLLRKYQGYELKWAILGKADNFFEVKVPALSIEDLVPVSLTQAGPRFFAKYDISKRQWPAVKEAFAADTAAFTVRGEISAHVQQVRRNEQKSLSASTCRQLVDENANVYTMTQKLAPILNQVNKMEFNYPQTRDSLKKNIFESCLQIEPTRVLSVQDLLQLKVRLRPDYAGPTGRYSFEFGGTKTVRLKYIVRTHLKTGAAQ